ncbi:MAG: lipoprotein-releasing system ATP-binding protein LolD [Bacteroidetes bacterium]|nr:MAG: lipoprotein-releasing system ATP-binding protein LolD [Bacteroidota bacterium]
MIKAENIIKTYGRLQVLKGVNLEVQKGEIVSITGSSGAGKSTLLHILGTLDKADGGNITIDGVSVMQLKDKALAAFRNKHIGFVFQFHHLLPEFSALENVCIPAFIAGTSKAEAESKAKELLEYLGLSDRIQHKPSEMSGGEQQRVAIARALINQPSIVFADEPSGNLDAKNSAELHDLFFDLRKHFNQTFVIVTHDPILAEKADRKIVIRDGVIE